MYIHKIRSGKRNQCVKLLLRESYRANGTVKNRTLANLTDWHWYSLEMLRKVLEVKRRYSGTAIGRAFEDEANFLIARLIDVASAEAYQERYQLPDSLSEIECNWKRRRKRQIDESSRPWLVYAALIKPRYSRRLS